MYGYTDAVVTLMHANFLFLSEIEVKNLDICSIDTDGSNGNIVIYITFPKYS